MLKPLAVAALAAATAAQAADDPLTRPIMPKYAAQWLGPQAPARIFGDTYFVGFEGLSIVLIRTDAGLILVDAGPPQAAPLVEAKIRQLGFRVRDVRYILNTESHWDHSGGLAALARDSGAVVVASPSGARALRAGRWVPEDPQARLLQAYPPVRKVQEIADRGTIRLGGATVTARFTPGHTPGSTSWTWTACQGRDCKAVVFGSSLRPISYDGFRFEPKVTPVFRRTFRTVAALPCDILISAHPNQSGFDQRLRTRAFVDPGACRAYAARSEALFDQRLAEEKADRQ